MYSGYIVMAYMWAPMAEKAYEKRRLTKRERGLLRGKIKLPSLLCATAPQNQKPITVPSWPGRHIDGPGGRTVCLFVIDWYRPIP